MKPWRQMERMLLNSRPKAGLRHRQIILNGAIGRNELHTRLITVGLRSGNNVIDFERFYTGIHGHPPFPWQTRLAKCVVTAQWPDAVHLPTSAGKTAIIDVWLWGITQRLPGVPRRLYYLIDRRALVDAAADYAQKCISAAGCDAGVVRLRGGLGLSEEEWLLDPSRPTLLSTTVDQLGSRLLGRAYGVGLHSAAIHAGLAGNDALIVLDEAHLIEPLRQTLERVAELRCQAVQPLPMPWHVVTMTATPLAAGRVLGLNDEDRSHPLLAARFGASKLATLTYCGEDAADAFAREALARRASGAEVVGVVVNTVDLARQIFTRLAPSGQAILLIGRSRPIERDAVGAELLARSGTESRIQGREPIFVVATQTIEVGLDLDFDALVTEIAPISALRQRFGRLDRLGALGTSRASVVIVAARNMPYGKEALAAAAKWLKSNLKPMKGIGKVVDFGVNAFERYDAPPEESGKDAPALLAVDLPLMFDPGIEIDVAPYLHGERRTSDIHLAWRLALDELPPEEWSEHVEAVPPTTLELMPVPVHAARAWLAGDTVQVSDLETEPSVELSERTERPSQREFVLWDGDTATTTTDAWRIRAGMIVVLPATAGGCDRFGWAPESAERVQDLLNSGRVRSRRWRGDNTRTSHAVGLADHLKGVGATARRYAENCGLPAHLVDALDEAGRLHDLGKNDPRFQLLLGARPGELLAKSAVIDPRVTRELAGLSRGWRHEVASLAQRPALAPLVRYLIGTHHGRGKPWLPAGPDVDVWEAAGGAAWPSLHREMVGSYGHWGVAYLEALLRLADWARSSEEQSEAALLCGEPAGLEAA